MTTRSAAIHCPVCGTSDPRPIVYGLPDFDLFEDPSVELGGCMISDDSPAWKCRNERCSTAFS